MAIDRLFDKIAEMRNPSVVGLDTKLEYLPQEILQRFEANDPFTSAANLILEYNKGLIDALHDIVPAIKPQMAYYEMYGWQGVKAYANTIAYAKQKDMFVITDGKRNDIGTTAQAYSAAYLGKTTFPDDEKREAFDSDMLTVTAYLGEDGIKPFVKDSMKYDKGIFVLVKTSNPSSGQLQDKEIAGQTVYDLVASMVEEWGSELIGKYGYSAIGAVVGATYPKQGAELRNKYQHIPFLVPGYGAQGATGDDIALCFDEKGFGAIVNASRSIICAHQKQEGMQYGEAARKAALDMKEDLLASLKKANRLSY